MGSEMCIRDRHATACLHGITRGLVLELATELGIPSQEKNISLTELYSADEVFCTGTMGELTPINKIDGRQIDQLDNLKVMRELITAFEAKIPAYSLPIV